MEILLVILLLAVATFVVAVWAFFFILSRVIRAIFGIARLPGRAASAAMRRRESDVVFDSVTHVGARRCSNGRCGAGMPAEARFCGRCGCAVTAGAMFNRSTPDLNRLYVKRHWRRACRRGGWQVVAGATTVSMPRPSTMTRVA